MGLPDKSFLCIFMSYGMLNKQRFLAWHSTVTHSDAYVTIYIDSLLSIFIQVIPGRVPMYGLLHFKGICHERNMRAATGDFLSVAVMLIFLRPRSSQ